MQILPLSVLSGESMCHRGDEKETTSENEISRETSGDRIFFQRNDTVTGALVDRNKTTGREICYGCQGDWNLGARRTEGETINDIRKQPSVPGGAGFQIQTSLTHATSPTGLSWPPGTTGRAHEIKYSMSR